MKEQFLIPFFVLTPILFHGKISGFLFAGRKVEAVHLAASRLMIHDTNALEAIAGIISTFMIQKEQINLIETERNRISRELHDDIGAELTRIIVLGQLLQKQMTTDEQMLNKLRKISESGKKVLGGIGEIIWTMNKQNDNLESLFAYIRRFVSEYLEMNGIEVNIAFPDEIPSVFIHDEWRRSIFLVIKEAVHNITKYAQASRVNLEMEIREGLVWLKIYDDGVGFCDTEKSGWGNGLNNMEQRMKDIGGTIEIRSEKGRGTRIRLSFAYC